MEPDDDTYFDDHVQYMKAHGPHRHCHTTSKKSIVWLSIYHSNNLPTTNALPRSYATPEDQDVKRI
eukprot:5991430-Amphidinium_carterae.1